MGEKPEWAPETGNPQPQPDPIIPEPAPQTPDEWKRIPDAEEIKKSEYPAPEDVPPYVPIDWNDPG